MIGWHSREFPWHKNMSPSNYLVGSNLLKLELKLNKFKDKTVRQCQRLVYFAPLWISFYHYKSPCPCRRCHLHCSSVYLWWDLEMDCVRWPATNKQFALIVQRIIFFPFSQFLGLFLSCGDLFGQGQGYPPLPLSRTTPCLPRLTGSLDTQRVAQCEFRPTEHIPHPFYD